MTVGSLIAEVEAATPDATPVERVTRAQLRALLLAESGEQLVGHFVSRAKEAGASWAAIGEALGVSRQAAQQSGRSRYARFTQRARNVVVRAQEAARSQRNHHIGTEHLLIGVIGESEGVGARLLREATDSTIEIDVVATGKLRPSEDAPAPAKIPFTPRATDALDRAAAAAAGLGHDFVGTEHLLLGLFGTGGQADEALREFGLDVDTIRERVRSELSRLFEAASKDLPPAP